MFKRSLTAAMMAFALTATALAAQPAAPTKLAAGELQPFAGDMPAPLVFAKSSGALEVYKNFPAAGGLTGWLVQDKNAGKYLVVYTTKDASVLLAGMALDATGRNLTSIYAEQHVPQPDYSVAYAELNQSATVVVGNPKAKAAMTIIFDANCGFCKIMHKLVNPAVEAGELRVTYVPVAIMGADSDVKAAGMLASKNPGAAVHASTEGATEVSHDKTLLAKVAANTVLMKKHGFTGTPGVLYKAKVGGEETIYVSPGVPNITEMFSRMGISGQVEKLRANPELGRFLR
jgi:thiol:disulfide interchange protein DsbG